MHIPIVFFNTSKDLLALGFFWIVCWWGFFSPHNRKLTFFLILN